MGVLRPAQQASCLLMLMTMLLAGTGSAWGQDADADGVLDSLEEPGGDTDGDGIPDQQDNDDDNDTRLTIDEEGSTQRDQDGDGTPDYLDRDEDDDTLAGLQEDVTGDGRLSAQDDTDGDGLIDSLDADDDGDGLNTVRELLQPVTELRLDTDGDGRPDSLDSDDDNDGVSTLEERRYGPEADSNGNGIPAYRDPSEIGPTQPDSDGDGAFDSVDDDDDGDGVSDVAELSEDTDGDQAINRLDADDDGDGAKTAEEHEPGVLTDTDGDGRVNYLDNDDDGDGVPTASEQPDPNGDGRTNDARRTIGSGPDYLNSDDDLDELPTRDERPDGVDRDTDGDGLPDYLEPDDDGDDRLSAMERGRDSDADGLPDELDNDDDADSIPTKVECGGDFQIDFDGDGVVNCLDLDSDGDALPDAQEGLPEPGKEGLPDRDMDGQPDYLDADGLFDDSDRDSVTDRTECPQQPCRDSDGDGLADVADPDDDNDGIRTHEEGAPSRDTDGDGVPDYLDPAIGQDGGVSDAGASIADAGTLGLDAGSGGLGFLPPSDEGGCSVHLRRTPDGSWLLVVLTLLGALRRARRAAVGAALLFPAAACDEDRDTHDVSQLDASLLDAASGSDAGSDSSVATDCRDDRLTFSAPDVLTRSFGAVVVGERVHLAYLSNPCVGPGGARVARGVSYVSFATTGPSAESVLVTGDSCVPVRDPTLVASSSASPTLFFSMDGEGGDDVMRSGLSANVAPTRETPTPDLRERLLSAATLVPSSAPTIAFAAEPWRTSEPSTPTALGATHDGRLTEILGLAAQHRAVQLSLVALGGASGPARGVAVWRSDLAPRQGIFARFVDASGAGIGEVVEISRVVGADSAFGLAAHPSGAGLIYSEPSDGTSYDLRFRAIASNGEVGSPVVLTTGGNPSVGRVALSEYRAGYAAVFHNLGSVVNPSRSIQVLGLDRFGVRGKTTQIAAGTQTGTHLQAMTASDGRLVLVWDERGPTSASSPDEALSIAVARLTCL